MSDWLVSFSEQAPWLLVIFLLLGIVTLVRILWFVATSFAKHCLRCGKGTNQYKGQQSWVVVTGGSDGIGLSICYDMAAAGFNVCMVARNQAKMEEKLKEIQAKHPVVTRALVFDFNEHTTIDKYQALIADKLKDIDVAMVFLNAGYAQMGAFEHVTQEDIQKMCNINALQPIYTACVLAGQLIKRKQRSAIVVVSSVAASQPFPGGLTYSCTKIFADYLGQGLNYEFARHNIDVLSWQPAGVATKMSKLRAGGTTLSPDTAVKSMMRDLGNEGRTYGHWKHAMQAMFARIVPLSLLKAKVLNGMIKMHMKQCQKGYAVMDPEFSKKDK